MQNRWLSVFRLDSLYVILACCVQHVFNENTVASGGVVNKNMSHCAHQFAVLNNRRAGHVCVKYRTTFCANFIRFVMNSI